MTLLATPQINSASSITLFGRWYTNYVLSNISDIRLEKAQLNTQIAHYDIDTINSQIETTQNVAYQLDRLQAELKLSKELINVNSKKLYLSRAYYDSGRIDSDRFLKSQTELRTAKINYSRQLIEGIKLITGLYRLMPCAITSCYDGSSFKER